MCNNKRTLCQVCVDASLIEEILLKPYEGFIAEEPPRMQKQMGVRQLLLGCLLCLRAVIGPDWPQQVCLLNGSVEDRMQTLSMHGDVSGVLVILHSDDHWGLLAVSEKQAVLFDSLEKEAITEMAQCLLVVLATRPLAFFRSRRLSLHLVVRLW